MKIIFLICEFCKRCVSLLSLFSDPIYFRGLETCTRRGASTSYLVTMMTTTMMAANTSSVGSSILFQDDDEFQFSSSRAFLLLIFVMMGNLKIELLCRGFLVGRFMICWLRVPLVADVVILKQVDCISFYTNLV